MLHTTHKMKQGATAFSPWLHIFGRDAILCRGTAVKKVWSFHSKSLLSIAHSASVIHYLLSRYSYVETTFTFVFWNPLHLTCSTKSQIELFSLI